MVAIAIEATRVTLIQILLSPPSPSSSGGPSDPNAPTVAGAISTGMSPLKSLYFFAPTCLALNSAALVALEGLPALRAIPALGAFTILSNSGLTLLLNLSAVALIGISAMVLSLSKIVKDILMVALPVVLMGENVRVSRSSLSSSSSSSRTSLTPRTTAAYRYADWRVPHRYCRHARVQIRCVQPRRPLTADET